MALKKNQTRLEDRAPLLVLLIGLLLTGISAWGARQYSVERDRLRFELAISTVEENLRDRIDLYVGVLWAAVGLFQANDLNVTPEQFRKFRLTTDWGERNDGLAGLTFTQKVEHKNLEAFVKKNREKTPSFKLDPVPSPDQRVFYSVTHIEPSSPRRAQFLGMDPFVDPARRRAMERAAITGGAAVTDKLVLRSDEELGLERSAILLYAPTYYPGAELLPAGGRSHLIHGFVGAGFYLDGFIEHLRRGPTEKQIGFQILSGVDHTGSRLLAQTGIEQHVSHQFHETRTLSVPGGAWTITYWTLPEFHAHSSFYQVPLVALAGLLLSLALYSLAVVQARARKARELALHYEIERGKDLEEQDKAKTRFFSNLNHELRTPLNGILGMSDLLYDTKLDETQKDYLNSISSCGKALLDLIGDVLDLSKINAGKMDLNPTPHNLKELFCQALEVVQGPAQGKGVALELDWHEEIPGWAEVDGLRLRQVLINLLGNAVKFTSEGSVTLCAHRVDIGNTTELHFEVKDTGVGISPDDVRRLFRPFSQLNNDTNFDQKGTGLGLHLCKELLEMMDGSIRLESELGKGTIFHCRLPIQEVDTNPYETQTLPEAASQLAGQLRILVVDDNPLNRRVLSLQLEKMGQEALIAEGGQQAVEMVESNVLDLVLMDCQMPEVDGLEATRRIRAREAKGPIIVALTAFSEESQRQACLDAGMDDFLTKPVDASLLRELIRKISRRVAEEYDVPVTDSAQ